MKRRRIDTVLEPEFLVDLETVDLAELRGRRDLAEDVESQISYYRRLIHGRMDLLAYELRRRRGEEERSLIDALPDILAAGIVMGGDPANRHIETMPPIPTTTGRRLIDKIMDDGVLANLPDLDDEEVGEALDRLSEMEGILSAQRRQLHGVIDAVHREIVARYRAQLDETPASG